MGTHENKDLVTRFTEDVMNGGNLDALADYLSVEFFNHVTGQAGIPAYRSVLEWARQLQGDSGTNVIDDVIAEGDRVSLFVTLQGRLTNQITVFGVTFPATGQPFTHRQVHTFRIEDHKLVEHWAIRDDLAMLMQLGARVCGPSNPS